jgi:2-methylaconitate cis-trans-isomerase PrpF
VLIHVAKAEGSVSPTVVLDGSHFKGSPKDAMPLLKKIYEEFKNKDANLISKYAVIKPSNHPMYDIDYLFFQLIPGEPVTFDIKGSCGHSILASICVAMEWGWISNVKPGLRVRVFIQNIEGTVVCEIDKTNLFNGIECTAHFINNSEAKLRSMLPTGKPTDLIKTNLGDFEVSIVSAGNPYVFIKSTDLGIQNEHELFEADHSIFNQLQIIRKGVSNILGWDPNSVFPKITTFGHFRENFLSTRAISVPSWHPTLALTGAACLSVAAAIKDTVVYKVADKLKENNFLHINTKGGRTGVSCTTTGENLDDYLLYSSISNKKVNLLFPLNISVEEGFIWQQEQKRQQVLI